MKKLEKEIEAIKQRNKNVETDKAREKSKTKKISIALLTYIIIVIFFYTTKLWNPRINAIVPTLWFLLSTLSLEFFKKTWIKKYKK